MFYLEKCLIQLPSPSKASVSAEIGVIHDSSLGTVAGEDGPSVRLPVVEGDLMAEHLFRYNRKGYYLFEKKTFVVQLAIREASNPENL